MRTTGSTESAQNTSKYAPTISLRARVTSDSSYPTLSTRRFRFRPFALTDIGRLAALAGEHRVADTSIAIPHPYTREFARLWVASHKAAWKRRRALHWAALKVGEERMVGYAGLSEIDMDRRQAEMRFWVGCGVERKSNAIEWSAAIVDFALTRLKLNRVYALQLARHPRTARILASIGMQREGFVRERICKDGLSEDVVCWAIVRNDS